jgi:hypothetical protein
MRIAGGQRRMMLEQLATSSPWLLTLALMNRQTADEVPAGRRFILW